MGKPMYSCGTQVKERARQQKQIDKASERILARQKKAYKDEPSECRLRYS